MFVIAQLLGCTLDQQPPLPEKIEGLWQLHQVETKDAGIVEAMDMLLKQYPDCSWGRMTWTFDADANTWFVDNLMVRVPFPKGSW